MECLGIDYGERRIGLAWGNSIGVATPLPAATQAAGDERMEYIGRLIRERRISQLVIGYPYNMDGSIGFKAREVDAFIRLLDQQFGLPIARIDERLTSHQAQNDLNLHGRSERRMRQSGVVDSAAACLILQDWLDMNLPPLFPEPELMEE